ncbi:hypothetical protein K438DRAFT_1856840 [Mycena galopus ATCC 62051]|nr:hypothetical protein K438DRAFT_1856840 [Mycena galopus ATCC 62051]
MNVRPKMDPVLSDAPLLLLPAEVAKGVELWRYIVAGTSAVFVWDILSNLKGDYTLLFKYRPRWPVAAYFLSRITSAVYVIGFTIFLTYPVEGCRTFDLGLQILYPISIPSTSLLFFFRVRAIYGDARMVTIIFGLMWVVVLATCIMIPFATGGVNIGTTRYFIVGELAPSAVIVGIAPAVFDTTVFIAISYRLIGNTHTEYSWIEKARTFLTGAYLPSFSKSLLVDGQVYYMITVVSNTVTAIMACRPPIGIAYRSLPVLPNVMLTSVMACRVYRHTRLNPTQQYFVLPTHISPDTGVELATQSQSLHLVYPTQQMGTKDCEVGEREDHASENGQC